jgi:eukaryotic-like serine/threonine-protein kinase
MFLVVFWIINMSLDSNSQGVKLPKSIFNYEVIDYIGQGAGSFLYAVTDPKTNQIYALKHVPVKTEKDERYVEQLESEYEIGKSISSPGLRRSVELKVHRNLLRRAQEAVLVLELFDGEPLENNPPERMVDIAECFIQVGQALTALHQAGYVHCDLKPNNIMLGSDGRVKVIDLGQACKINTIKKRIQGTPDYISPEQVKCQAVTPRTDVYNFGATLYWVLTGKNLPTLFTLKRSDNSLLVDTMIDSPLDLNPKVPESLSKLVMECVRVNPAKRPEMPDIVRRLEIIQFTIARAAKGGNMLMHA